MSDKTTVIVNGAAGGGRCREAAEGALSRLRALGIEADVHYTERAGHASELAKNAYNSGCRELVSVGGDGTTYEVVNGLFPRPEGHDDPIRLGILPLGTGNSFLRDFNVMNTNDALDALTRRRARSIDVVRVKHSTGVLHYINLLTIGFVTNAGDLTNRRFKPFGEAGYLMAAMVCIARLKNSSDPIRIDDGDIDARPAPFLVFSNSQFTGGSFHIAPHADPTDGEIDVIRAVPMNRGAFVKNLLAVYKGKHVEDPRVEERRAKKVTFQSPREHLVMLDGEILPLTLESLEVMPSALEVWA